MASHSRSKKLRIALVGSGFLARTRARCWRRVHSVDVDLAVVASRTQEGAAAFAKEWNIACATSDVQAAFGEDVDLVDLCVPNHLHRPLTEAAAAAGKDILCTKPLAAYVGEPGASAEEVAATDRNTMLARATEDARAMVDACQQAGVALHYGENWIHAPSVVRAAELTRAAKGVLLEMHGWEAHSGSHSPYSKDWRHTGGGALLRLGSHPIGVMLWLKHEEGLAKNGEPTRLVAVSAEVADLTQNPLLAGTEPGIATGWLGVENWGSVVLSFSDGSRGVAHGSDAMLGGMQSRLTLQGSDHHLECNLSPHDQVRAYAAHDGAFGSAYMMEKLDGQAGWSTPMPDEDHSSGQQGLCQAVAEAAAEGRASAATGELGFEVTRAVYAAYVSASEGRRVTIAPLR